MPHEEMQPDLESSTESEAVEADAPAQADTGEDSSPSYDDIDELVAKALGSEPAESDDDGEDAVADDEPDPESSDGESSPPEGAESEGEGSQDSETDSEGSNRDEDTSDEALLKMLDQLRDKDAPLSKVERFREVIAEKNALKAQIEQHAPIHEELSRMWENATSSGFTQDEMQKFFAIPNLAASSPEQAVQVLQELSDTWGVKLGAALPQDLRQAVDDGEITAERAREVAEARRVKAQAERQSVQTEEQKQHDEQVRQVTEVRNAITDWERNLVSRTPDFTPVMHEMLSGLVKGEIASSGYPRTTKQAVEICDRALGKLNKLTKSLRPQPQKITPKPGRSVRTPSSPEPKDMAEAINRALDEM